MIVQSGKLTVEGFRGSAGRSSASEIVRIVILTIIIRSAGAGIPSPRERTKTSNGIDCYLALVGIFCASPQSMHLGIEFRNDLRDSFALPRTAVTVASRARIRDGEFEVGASRSKNDRVDEIANPRRPPPFSLPVDNDAISITTRTRLIRTDGPARSSLEKPHRAVKAREDGKRTRSHLFSLFVSISCCIVISRDRRSRSL